MIGAQGLEFRIFGFRVEGFDGSLSLGCGIAGGLRGGSGSMQNHDFDDRIMK